ncbi:LPXTG cell wall anchor domain-containing protein [Streptomyces sp. NPDC058623]|uniref:LPXTG cell wall anchor domain-containing protein n=1 Tax=Streptomyces sp. NPDC058623 TaxID=3346563 RepID=UPI003646F3FD
MSARRPLLTALGATTLLAVLWFVPSANATAPDRNTAGSSGGPAAANTGTVGGVPAGDDATGSGPSDDADSGDRTATVTLTLADTGSTDTTPYVLGGTLCLGLGAGFVTFSVRRSRTP